MSGIDLFAVSAQQAQWLSVRQSAVAKNIANANTPGYKPVDVEPFERILDKSGPELSATATSHMTAGLEGLRGPSLKADKTWQVSPSGNAVSLEQELIKADEINRAYALNVGIVKAFHRMLMLSVK
jgi:flagellar basal-body rod protein FlgB